MSKKQSWDDFIAEVKAVEEANKPYWRLYMTDEGKAVVVCLQPIDEYDYDKSRFISPTKYETEELAEKALMAIRVRAHQPLTGLDRYKLIARLLESEENE